MGEFEIFASLGKQAELNLVKLQFSDPLGLVPACWFLSVHSTKAFSSLGCSAIKEASLMSKVMATAVEDIEQQVDA